ncbi:metallophosphoesterase [Synechococcus sp. WH 8016]|uniref:metallophosphoesterase n=1 Tax=Synechococcus sp. WH 8016 TaxID=166318 RepID=UPI00030FD925|nr:metallophosphoesterase [Synechococcus sp. WH 8016]
MNFASDPSIQRKISKMAARVCWNHPELSRQGIDQTRLVIDQGNDTVGIDDAFHFLVLGDSGTGRHRLHSPPRRIAERLLPHKSAAAFLLHTGDVVYLVGAMDQYRANFLRPYREWLHYGKDWKTISPEGLMFNQPFLPVLGNHDYYDLSLPVALIAGLTLPFRRHLQWFDDIDAGWRGSRQGEAYACVFLDVLNRIPPVKLSDHLKLHYNAVWDGHRCLRYRPGVNTRLPNRYYRFQHAGVDVFALDSNTLITPDQATNNQRNLRRDLRTLEERQSVVYRRLASSSLDENHRDDLFDELETLQEECFDLQRQIKQINQLKQSEWVDHEQLEWLKEGLIRSHRDRSVRGRILTMHHPAYVTEKTKCGQADTKAIRRQMRDVFDAVVLALGEDLGQARPVDLVLSGHAHCLEVIRSHDTGHADSHINWVICGGSGYGLRAQRREGAELTEQTVDGNSKVVATSELFIGRNWPAAGGRDSYSGLRVDIAEGRPLSIRLTPLVSCRDSNGWLDADPESIRLRM